jgi:hypothetical protein
MIKKVYRTRFLEGIAYENDIELTDSEKIAIIKKANDYFNNAFLLVYIAPSNLRDSGTTRSIKLQDGKERLMITYTFMEAHLGPAWLIEEIICQKHGECGSALFLLWFRN